MPAPIQVYAGNAVTTTCTFTVPPSTTPVDPDTIVLKYKAGSNSTVTWTYGGMGSITRTTTGVYAAILDTTSLAGNWVIEWIGTGACAAVSVSYVAVETLPI